MAEHGHEVDGGIELDINLSQNDFARLCMGSRQRINKIFREWNEAGTVAFESDHYIIKDLAALQKEIQLD